MARFSGIYIVYLQPLHRWKIFYRIWYKDYSLLEAGDVLSTNP